MLVTAVLTATSHSHGNGKNSTPHKIQTPQLITIKLCRITYLRQTRNPNLVQIGRKEASGQIREILGLFLLFPFSFFPWLAYWSGPSADFDAQWLKLRGITQGCAFWGSARWPTTFSGSNSSKTLLKYGVIKQSQPSQKKMKISISSKPSNLF